MIARELEELNRARQVARSRGARRRHAAGRGAGDARSVRPRASREGWHAGVIGIVASRIVEATARPAVLVARHDGIGKGLAAPSARSICTRHFRRAASQFTRFGGHRAAAGLTMDAERLPAFVEQFDEIARARLKTEDLMPEIRIDLQIPIDAVGRRTREARPTLRAVRHRQRGADVRTRGVHAVGAAAQGRRRWAAAVAAAPEAAMVEAIGWGMARIAARWTSRVPSTSRTAWNATNIAACRRLQLKAVRPRVTGVGVRIVAGRWRGRKNRGAGRRPRASHRRPACGNRG